MPLRSNRVLVQAHRFSNNLWNEKQHIDIVALQMYNVR
jgi:hypothetical protein